MCSTENSAQERDLNFYSLRNKVFPDFVSDQGRAADAIYALMHPYLIKGQIRTIIDFGCGSGEILSAICRKLKFELEFRSKCGNKEVLKLSDYRFVGIDRNASEITEAKAKKCRFFNDEDSPDKPSCGECDSVLFFKEASVDNINVLSWFKEHVEDYVCRAETYSDASVLRVDKAPRALDWNTCCVILTGHTLPYMEVWEATSQWLRESGHSPKFFYFDICTTFDRAIEHLRDQKRNMRYTEPLHIEPKDGGNEIWFSRDTENIKDDEEHVRRLFSMHEQGNAKAELFSEKQMKMKASEFIQNLQAIGRNKDDFEFRVVERIHYKGGYAPHTGYFCMLRTRVCQVLDKAYCASLENLAKDVLFEQGNPKKSCGLLGNPLCDLKDLKIVTAFLPFDSCCTQMRYIEIALSDDRKTQALNTGGFTTDNVFFDFLPPPPSIVSASLGSKESSSRPVFIPAPSLKTAVLMPHSVSNVRALIQHESYIFANYDKRTLEAIALEAGYDPKKKSQSNGEAEGKTPAEYFILPIFYGTLPLYCFIFDLGRIPGAYIQQETYDTLLLSIRSLTKSRLSEQVLKQFLERFASEGLGGLSSQKDISEKELPETLDKAFKMVLEKPWYSWADIIPTKQNKESFVAQAENETLLRLWQQALEEVLAEPRDFCFKQMAGGIGFFEKEAGKPSAHERASRVHGGRAKKILDEIIAKNDRKFLENQTDTWMCIPKLNRFVYDDSVPVVEPLIVWMFKMLSSIESQHSQGKLCSEAKCKRENEIPCTIKNADIDFLKLKGMFNPAGTGSGPQSIRFSLWRIIGAIEAYGKCETTVSNYTSMVVNKTKQSDYDIKDAVVYWKMKNDQSVELEKLLSLLLPRMTISTQKITMTRKAGYVRFCLSFRGALSEAGSHDGNYFGKLKSWVDENATTNGKSNEVFFGDQGKPICCHVSFLTKVDESCLPINAPKSPIGSVSEWISDRHGKFFRIISKVSK